VPVALFLLVYFCRDRSVMGPLVNAPLTTRVAGVSAAVVAVLGCCLPFTL
jgi:manganese transport protein